MENTGDLDAYRPPGRLSDRHDAQDRHVVVAARVGWQAPGWSVAMRKINGRHFDRGVRVRERDHVEGLALRPSKVSVVVPSLWAFLLSGIVQNPRKSSPGPF